MDKTYGIPPEVNCLCHRTNKIVRFGQAVMCLDDHCLGAWLVVRSRSMPSVHLDILRIKHEPSRWQEFLAHFAAYAWYRVANAGANGLSVFDVANAIRTFGSTWRGSVVEEPVDVSLTDDIPDTHDDTEYALRHAVACIGGYPPSLDLPLSLQNVDDPLLPLYWAGELRASEAALFSGMNSGDFIAYAERVRLEVRDGKKADNL